MEILIFWFSKVNGHLLPIHVAKEDKLREDNVAGQLQAMLGPSHAQEVDVELGEGRHARSQQPWNRQRIVDDCHSGLHLAAGVVREGADHSGNEQREDHIEDEVDALEQLLAPHLRLQGEEGVEDEEQHGWQETQVDLKRDGRDQTPQAHSMNPRDVLGDLPDDPRQEDDGGDEGVEDKADNQPADHILDNISYARLAV